jgi:hypothetical protein
MDLKSRSGINSPTVRPKFVDLTLNSRGEVERVDGGRENRDEDEGADGTDEKQFQLKMHLRKVRYLSYAKFLLAKRHSKKRGEFD